MKRLLSGIFDVIVLGLVLVSPGLCATIRGTVKTSDGKPVSGVKIAVVPFQMSASPQLAVAEQNKNVEAVADGSYTITNLPPGNYVMKLLGVAALGQDG